MPSPVAHSLAGLAVAGLAQYVQTRRGQRWPPPARPRQTALTLPLLAVALIGAASAPDLDFVPGVLVGHPDWLHRGLSHSLLAAACFGVLAYVVTRVARLGGAGVFGLLMGLAYASHLVLDMFSPDPLRFNGVPVFWPLSESHFVLPAQVFLDIRRDPGAGGFLASLWHVHNLQALVREILIMTPILLVGRVAARIVARRDDRPAAPVRTRLDRRLDSES